MTEGKTAFNEVENILLGRLYKEDSDNNPSVYRMGLLKVERGRNEWEVYNLTNNFSQSLFLSELCNLKRFYESDLTSEEAKNLEKLLRKPSE